MHAKRWMLTGTTKRWLIALLIIAGCSTDPAKVALSGNWDEKFVATAPVKHGEIKGYLQLYQTEDRFKISLSDKVQSMEITGKWELKDNRVTLTPTNGTGISYTGFQNADEPTKDPTLMTTDRVTQVLGKQILLTLSADKATLTSMPLDLGPVKGSFTFQHGDVLKYNRN